MRELATSLRVALVKNGLVEAAAVVRGLLGGLWRNLQASLPFSLTGCLGEMSSFLAGAATASGPGLPPLELRGGDLVKKLNKVRCLDMVPVRSIVFGAGGRPCTLR